MEKREVVKRALAFKEIPYIPWHFKFTVEAKDKLLAHLKGKDIEEYLQNHMLELGNDIGFFEYLGDNLYKDVFGVVWDRSIDKDIGNVKGTLLAEPTLKGYHFPDPLDSRFFEDIPGKITMYGDKFRLFAIGFSLFERAWTMRGMENLLMDFCINPEFVHELMSAITDYNIAQIEKAFTYDVDAVELGDDWGQQRGLIMGYESWKDFIYPYLKKTYKVIKDKGKYVFIHSCGDVDELFDDLIDIGVDCFNPFQPEVMDVISILAQYHKRLSFWGGLSIQKTLPFGTVHDVVKETHTLMEAGKRGGYIFSPSHAVEGDTSINNIIAFIEEARNQLI
ncbi:MAG: uroporphyrinogen-III decarboxylase-like protein [Bacteroidetes bacterium GWE2_41_25]|nr:MAG: uroporphyrinogen-III decarboxylase-like protein [Bacteroidetes bacterium GWA2_40_15]OFX89901.1 MAG: uroporphyrinogen-III decarboxylase-like protein [Bacteroidetes bacterium GWC2_40_22]OFY03868.1 MAG: uroporphyrinogen-III decarboxylase-like protein [Bacteroidetes bacterium GWE2_41_25]OFY60729.1 MAG: uroporphyrinogen-III decarboxylase-like protein [Bacteroidetes bacterium GWF2_41_9]HAM11094.1 uroporphyrinogen-III decarboxylase-like protein [Bacteroidales bacterium]